MDPFLRIDPSLTDFLLLALLLTFMHLLTVIEVTRGDPKDTVTAGIDRTRAATLSFAGILFTLGAGIAARAYPGTPYAVGALAVPILFIVRWAVFHWRISRLLDGSVIQMEFRSIHEKAVLEVIRGSSEGGLSPEEVASRILPHLGTMRSLLPASVFKRIVPMPVGELFERLLPTAANLRPVLDDLSKDGGVLRRDNGKYYLATR